MLDGGNLVHNGRVAIVTEKVLKDNHHLSRGEVERMICMLGFARVVFIPVEPGDDVGHSDGVCRFIFEGVLLVNDYRSDPEARDYGTRLRKVFKAAKLDAELVPFPWFCTEGRLDGVSSAVGCYMNFLQVAQGVVLPLFDHPYDEKAYRVLKRFVQRPVVQVRATALAEFGGVFNCASLTV